MGRSLTPPHPLQTAKGVCMMFAPKKTASLLRLFALLVCSSFVLLTGAAQDNAGADYTFETIEVPGVDFLALTASNDFEEYAGYTRNADGKEVAFTLMDGEFTTYDFPGSQKTHFYALANNGIAAGPLCGQRRSVPWRRFGERRAAPIRFSRFRPDGDLRHQRRDGRFDRQFHRRFRRPPRVHRLRCH